ncbi:response regulator transcription factor [Flavisolibacter sp. BT320]|nr:response regulator transcription factor [Flavisolibacter longurius]
MIKAILIDDEKNALEMLEWQLQNYCPQVQVGALCGSADEGITAIRQHVPQLVFLDIEMPHKNGFEVIYTFPEPTFDVIFTTAYDQFAIKAFKFAALDYLLKPIDADELVAAVQRYEKKQRHHQLKDQLDILLQQYKQPQLAPGRIPFATQEGLVFIRPETIVRCEASSNYTTLHFSDKTKMVVSKTLKDVEDLLNPYGFFRVHHSHLINLQQVSRYVKADGGFIEMADGSQVPVSRQRKDFVLDVLTGKH